MFNMHYIGSMNDIVEFTNNGCVITDANDIFKHNKNGTDKFSISILGPLDEVNIIQGLLEKDVKKNTNGKFYCGDYYMNCVCIESSVKNYYKTSKKVEVKLIFESEDCSWKRETLFRFDGIVISSGKNMDFESDFSYDYTSNNLNKKLINSNFVDSNFRLVIYGIAENPEVTIGGQLYSVGVSVGKNEYLTIDSVEKTVVLTKHDGSTVNCFNLRDKDSYIFQKIPIGELDVLESSPFNFDITLIEERNEPKWT